MKCLEEANRDSDPMRGGGLIEAAPPARDRVETDARDALPLARLLCHGEIVPVRIPSAGQQAARDLVRAREASRSDLTQARHRLRKLLVRHGIVYIDGKVWTVTRHRWLITSPVSPSIRRRRHRRANPRPARHS